MRVLVINTQAIESKYHVQGESELLAFLPTDIVMLQGIP